MINGLRTFLQYQTSVDDRLPGRAAIDQLLYSKVRQHGVDHRLLEKIRNEAQSFLEQAGLSGKWAGAEPYDDGK
ncbi:MAG TPA: hypothetical protein VM782_04315 [Stellaceae bacterium]|nr:hypothetical protein [Stellaceae bacterium]